MSTYDNDTKIYPDLNPTAPQEPLAYRLQNLTEIERFFLDEVEVCERIAKKNKTILYNHRHLGHRTNHINGDHWSNFYCSICQRGVGLPACAALGGTSLRLSLATVITRKSFKTFTIKQEKHNSIKLLAQSKLDSIANIISQTMQDGDISPIEFHKVLQEGEKYRKLKADIRNHAKAKIKQITKEEREELLEEGRKEGKENFLQKTANPSGTHGLNVI